MLAKQKKTFFAIAAGCFVGQAALQIGSLQEAWAKDYMPKNGLAVSGALDPQQLLFALAGFREMIAGILWVRADSFFDSGNYDAVLPIIRLVTTLDPKQLDVYATGMWHIGYNFTDEDQRSDRRYVPSALALGKEGVRNNPETYEMLFETGWLWYNKIDDNYDKAVKYFSEASAKPDIQPARKNLLTNALIRNMQLDEALNKYYELEGNASKLVQSDPNSYGNKQNRDTVAGNLDNLIVRMSQRGAFAQKEGGDAFAKGEYDTKPPFDVNFGVKATVIDRRVIRFEGTWGVLPVGTRLRVTLKDSDYDPEAPAGLNWDNQTDVNLDPPKNRTIMQDQLYVKNRRFNKKVDMSKDVTMYPFTSKNYVLEFYYNPRSAPAHIQDKFGYDGSGMTDKNYLNTDVRKGQRVIYAKFELTRDQLLRQGEWQDKAPTFKTIGYEEVAGQQAKDDVILVPTLRSGQ